MRNPVITPSLVEIAEYETLTTTFTLSEYNPDLEIDVYYFKVFPISVAVNEYSTYSVQPISDTSFSLTITLSDVFPRSISYVSNLEKSTVGRFGSLPTEYDAVYKYIPPTTQYMSYFFNLPVYYGLGALSAQTLPNGTLVIEYHVRLDQTISNQAFKNSIANGKFTVASIAAGYY